MQISKGKHQIYLILVTSCDGIYSKYPCITARTWQQYFVYTLQGKYHLCILFW
jgi:hypothetical protein